MEKTVRRGVFDTAWGIMAAEENGRGLTRFFLPDCVPDGFGDGGAATPLLREAKRQVDEYIARDRHEFTLPLEPAGTGFQQSVWRQLRLIPFGGRDTYGGIAKALAKPGAARAVGLACRANPVPLLIPCHRVVGADGGLVGFSGGGVDVKRRLLAHEHAAALPAQENARDGLRAALTLSRAGAGSS